MKHTKLLLLGICPLLFAACQSTLPGDPDRLAVSQVGVQNRINQNQDEFSKLGSYYQKSVSQGTVSKGMSRAAVQLAWGTPDEVEKSKSGGKEIWTYYRTEQVDEVTAAAASAATAPAFTPPAGKLGSVIAFASKFYGSGGSSNKYFEGGTQSETRTIRRVNRTAVFENGALASWTRARH